MADTDHTSLAVLEARVNGMGEAIKSLVIIADSLRNVQSDTSQALKLLQLSAESADKALASHAIDLNELKSNRNMLRGGWLALCVLGTALVGLAGIVGALVAILSLKPH